jgi:LemA protein
MSTAILAAIILMFVFWYLATYNELVRARNATSQTWSNTEVELKRRLELITNLVEVVKGYSRHESETLQKVALARTSGQGFPSAAKANGLEGEFAGLSQRLVALAESYPDLKANNNYQQLSTNLIDTENRIAERRQAYNKTVNLYRNLQETFPSNLLAQLHRFAGVEFFKVPEAEASQVPQVKL